jgi:hypothetical protein
MHLSRAVSALLVGTLVVLHLLCWSGTASAAPALQAYRVTKGFVAAKADNTLTILAGNTRVTVVTTSTTRVLGQRDSFAAIVLNDVVRVEGRADGSRLLADRIEVILAADGVKVQNLPRAPTIEYFPFSIQGP